jgi:hypothetical protein
MRIISNLKRINIGPWHLGKDATEEETMAVIGILFNYGYFASYDSSINGDKKEDWLILQEPWWEKVVKTAKRDLAASRHYQEMRAQGINIPPPQRRPRV